MSLPPSPLHNISDLALLRRRLEEEGGGLTILHSFSFSIFFEKMLHIKLSLLLVTVLIISSSAQNAVAVVPFTAKDAARLTLATIDSYDGASLVKKIYEGVKRHALSNTDFCYTQRLNVEDEDMVKEICPWCCDLGDDAKQKEFENQVERAWPFLERQFKKDGFRIEEVRLRSKPVNPMLFVYGSDVSKCPDGATTTQEPGAKCVQKARVKLCWDLEINELGSEIDRSTQIVSQKVFV
jgi:hypothetical protein